MTEKLSTNSVEMKPDSLMDNPIVMFDGLCHFCSFSIQFIIIARNRYRWFGKRDVCYAPTAAEQSRFIA